MTTNPPLAEPKPALRSTAPADDPEAPLRELATKYPAPYEQDVREWIEDRLWLNEQLAQGAFGGALR